VSKASSDSPPKGLNWAGLKEDAEKFDDEQTRQYHLPRPPQGSDLKGLFSKQSAGTQSVDRILTPIIEPPSASTRKPKLARKKPPKPPTDNLEEPPASTFGSNRPEAPAPSASAKERDQAALGIFGKKTRLEPLSEDETKPPIWPLGASSPHRERKNTPKFDSPLVVEKSTEAKPDSTEEPTVVRPAPEPDSTEVTSVRPAPEPELHFSEPISLEPPPAARAEVQTATHESEPPAAPFSLPSPLPDKPPPPPIISLEPSSSGTVTSLPTRDNARPLAIKREELERLPPVKRERAETWGALLLTLFLIIAAGATGIYTGTLQLPFRVGSLFGRSPKATDQSVKSTANAPRSELSKTGIVPGPTSLEKGNTIAPANVEPPRPGEKALQETTPGTNNQPQGEPVSADQLERAKSPPEQPIIPAIPPETEPTQAKAATTELQPATQKPVAPAAMEKIRTKDLRSKISGADQLLKNGEITEAEAQLRQVLTQEPDEHHAMEILIRVLLKQGKAAESLPFAKRIVAKRPRRAPYRLLYGDALAASGDRAGAEAQWQEALMIEPGSTQAKRRLGQTE
jgi:hypothetical protein